LLYIPITKKALPQGIYFNFPINLSQSPHFLWQCLYQARNVSVMYMCVGVQKNVSILVCWCEQTCIDFYLGYLCMLEYSSVQHIFRLVYPMLPVSLACPLRYSLTFFVFVYANCRLIMKLFRQCYIFCFSFYFMYLSFKIQFQSLFKKCFILGHRNLY
jgi:hypothetical protein